MNTGSPGMALVMWGLTGITAAVSNLCLVELALTFPVIGSEYVTGF